MTIVSLGPRYVGVRDEFQLRNVPDTLRVYSVQTTRTTVSVACVKPLGDAAASGMAACDRMACAFTIMPPQGDALEARTGSDYYSQLRESVSRYSVIRLFLRALLANQRLGSLQAGIAEELATLSAQEAESVAELKNAVVPAEQQALHQALSHAGRGYTALSRAAAAGDVRRYAQASRKINAADAAAGSALREISKL